MSSATELADRLQAICTAFADYLEGLTPEQWRTTCGNHPHIRFGDEDEHRPVGTVAYHTAAAVPAMLRMVRGMAAGQAPQMPPPGRNEQQARENPEPDQAATIAALRQNAAEAAAAIREMSPDDLARTGPTPMMGEISVAQAIDQIMGGHVTWHEGSIRASLGH